MGIPIPLGPSMPALGKNPFDPGEEIHFWKGFHDILPLLGNSILKVEGRGTNRPGSIYTKNVSLKTPDIVKEQYGNLHKDKMVKLKEGLINKRSFDQKTVENLKKLVTEIKNLNYSFNNSPFTIKDYGEKYEITEYHLVLMEKACEYLSKELKNSDTS